MWTLISAVDTFELTARHLTKSYLARFRVAFREVFGRIDRKVEIPPSEWLFEDIKGQQGHSAWLRSGMAETLLLIAERGPDAQLICEDSPRAYVDEVVRDLPGLSDDWKLLASSHPETHYLSFLKGCFYTRYNGFMGDSIGRQQRSGGRVLQMQFSTNTSPSKSPSIMASSDSFTTVAGPTPTD